MRMLYHFLLQSFQKIRIQGWVREIDSKSPVQTGVNNSHLLQNGWSIMSSQELFGDSISKYICRHTSFSDIVYDSFGNWTSREIPTEVIEKVACNPKIQQIVTGYLGGGARLDDIYLWFKRGEPVEKSISEGWHDDNVGHRLKLFICLEAEPSGPRTFVVSTSHRELYRFNFFSEMRRYLLPQRASEETMPHGTIHEIVYEKDTIVFFDTNMKHKGDYERRPGKRHCLIVEFVDRNKSNKISGWAPCGPGQCREGQVKLSADGIQNLKRSSLIDFSLLKSLGGNVYSYSLLNLKEI